MGGRNCSCCGYNIPAVATAVRASYTIHSRSPCASKSHELAINLDVIQLND